MPTEKEKEKVREAIRSGKIIDDTTLKVFLMNEEMKDKLKDEKSSAKTTADEMLLIELAEMKGVRGSQGDKGDKGDSVKGDDGKTPTKEELRILIKPLILKPTDGKDGKDGKDAISPVVDESSIVERATKQALDKVLPTIPTIEQIEERLPVLGESVRNSLELLQDDDRIDVKFIKGLDKMEKALLERADSILDQRTQFLLAKLSRTNLNLTSLGTFVDDETPSGTVNGSNTDFTVANTPITNSLKVFVNGQRLKAGGEDYTLSGVTITFVTAPPTTSILTVDYRY